MMILSRLLPTRTIPYHIDICPDEQFNWFVVVLVGSGSRDTGPGGQ